MRTDTEESRDNRAAQSPDFPRQSYSGVWGWARQFLKFALVGLSSTGIELALYNILLLIHQPHSSGLLVVYSTVGVVAAVVNSYHWDSRWAFRAGAARHGHRAARQRLLLLVQSGFNIGINDGMVALIAPPLLAFHALPAAAAANLAKMAGMSAASLFSFVVLRLIVFR